MANGTNNTTKRNRILRITLYSLGIILLTGLIATWILSSYLAPYLKREFTKKVHEGSDGLYKLDMKDLDVTLATGTIQILDLKLSTDPNILKKLQAQDSLPENIIEVNSQNLRLSGIGIMDLLFSKKLDISSISMDSLNLVLHQHKTNNQKKEKTGTAYGLIKKQLKSLQIGKIGLKKANLTIKHDGKDLAVKNLDLHLQDILIDEKSEQDPTRVLFAKNIQIALPEFDFEIPNSPYKLSLKDLQLNAKDSLLTMKDLLIRPMVSRTTFAKNDKENKAMIELKLGDITMSGLQLRRFMDDKKIRAKNLQLENGNIDLSKDKRYQEEDVSKIGENPAQQIMSFDQRIIIDRVDLKGIRLSYTEKSKKYDRDGNVHFNQIQGSIRNVNNDTLSLLKNGHMEADLQGYAMGKGLLKAYFNFDMLSRNGRYSYKGSLGEMQAPAYNKILAPLLNIEINSGRIRRIKFDIHGDDINSAGTFHFDYDHLKLNILKDPDSGKKGKKGFLSLLANTFLINDSNPDANEKYTVAQIYYTRTPEHPYFKVVWKTLLQGIIECTGTNPDILPL